MVVENVVLAGWEGGAGMLLSATLLHVLPILLPRGAAHLDSVRLEPGTWMLALGLAVVSGLVLSLAPCWLLLARGTRSADASASRTSTAGLTTRRVRGAMMVAEFALAVTLVGGAALLVRSWWAVTHVDRGFSSERVVVMAVSTTAYDTPSRRAQYYDQVLDVLATVPEVEARGVISEVIVTSDADGVVTVDRPGGRAEVRLRMRRDEATAGAFEAIGAPLRRGRWFSSADRADGPPVLLINEAMASRLWPGLDPIGRRLTFGAATPQSRWFTVVGVLADLRRQGLERPPVPESFEAVSQNPPRLGTLLVRVRRHAPPDVASRLRAAVQHVDPKVPVYGMTMLDQRLEEEQWQRQVQTWLLVGVAAIALLMAATGVYGLTLHTVAARTREIGIRRALGADASRVLRAAVGDGLRLCAIGVTVGLAGAYLVGRTASGLLFGVSAADPIALAATVAALALVTLMACYGPARRALRVSPAVALRES
jgi:predicted permease